MNILIAEDEQAARENLIAILLELDASFKIVGEVESVEGLESWIASNNTPDIGFFDIQLSDTDVFEFFKNHEVHFPVVFVTAYSNYALKAFKVNSIDYILKPVEPDSVNAALNKLHRLSEFQSNHQSELIDKLIESIRQNSPKEYQNSFLVHKKETLIPVPVDEIASFHIENGIVFCTPIEGKSYMVSDKLDSIELKLDPQLFIRANRQYIVSKKSIKEIAPYFNDRLLVKLKVRDITITISKTKAGFFKKWMNS